MKNIIIQDEEIPETPTVIFAILFLMEKKPTNISSVWWNILAIRSFEWKFRSSLPRTVNEGFLQIINTNLKVPCQFYKLRNCRKPVVKASNSLQDCLTKPLVPTTVGSYQLCYRLPSLLLTAIWKVCLVRIFNKWNRTSCIYINVVFKMNVSQNTADRNTFNLRRARFTTQKFFTGILFPYKQIIRLPEVSFQ